MLEGDAPVLAAPGGNASAAGATAPRAPLSDAYLASLPPRAAAGLLQLGDADEDEEDEEEEEEGEADWETDDDVTGGGSGAAAARTAPRGALAAGQ